VSFNPTDVLDTCYDSPNYPNADCSKVTRSSIGQITLIQSGYTNAGYEDFDGLQSELDWTFDVPLAANPGGLGSMSLRLNCFLESHLNEAVGPEDVTAYAGQIQSYGSFESSSAQQERDKPPWRAIVRSPSKSRKPQLESWRSVYWCYLRPLAPPMRSIPISRSPSTPTKCGQRREARCTAGRRQSRRARMATYGSEPGRVYSILTV
jgi:hypothetical protein